MFFKKKRKNVYNIENLNTKHIYTAWLSLASCPLTQVPLQLLPFSMLCLANTLMLVPLVD